MVLAGGKGRISAAGDYWYRYFEAEENGTAVKTPILYISGMGRGSTWNTFQRQIRPGVLNVMKPSDVVLETESTDTVENAQIFLRNAQLRGWKRIVLLTSPYHMRRSVYLFNRVAKKAGFPLEIETMSVFQEPYGAEEWRESLQGIRVTMFEYLKWLYYTSFWNP